ncbi:hypothetical protein SDC9_210648 [bioreactor metagenome]|uniref:Uncharacterized protein n=1 Tax=bioreactor metagenome TaxID=1076179 RepID=A0A645JGU3_9ZZZZ
MARDGADAYHDLHLAAVHGFFYLRRYLHEILLGRAVGKLLDEGDVGLSDVQDEIVLPVGEKALHSVNGSRFGLVELAYDEHAP